MLQYGGKRSLEMLKFNFASTRFDYKRHAQSVNSSVFLDFKSFARVFWCNCQSSPMYAIGAWFLFLQPVTRYNNTAFKCFHKPAVKLTIEKVIFESDKLNCLVGFIRQKGLHHKLTKFETSSANWDSSNRKSLLRYLGLVKYNRNYMLVMAVKFNPLRKLPKREKPINIAIELEETFVSVSKALYNFHELALRHRLLGEWHVLMIYAGFRNTGFALRIQENPKQKVQPEFGTCAQIAFWSKLLCPSQLKISRISK